MDKLTYTPLLAGEKIRTVFLFQFPTSWPSWESVFNVCKTDSRFDVKIVLIDTASPMSNRVGQAESFLKEMRLPFTWFTEFKLENYKPHVVFFQSPYDDWNRLPSSYSSRIRALGARIVYIPYGIEFTDTPNARLGHFYTFTILNAWRIYVISELMHKEYYENCPNRHSVRVYGHPKFDAYTDVERFKLKDSLYKRIDGRKVILWKIHFPLRKYKDGRQLMITPDLNEYLGFAKSLPAFNDLFFIFMPHPNITSNEYQDEFRSQIVELFSMLDNMENVYIDTSADYRPSLLMADAVITDRSALMIEAEITGVPIFYMYSPDNTENLSNAVTPLVNSYYQGCCKNEMMHFVQEFIVGFDPKKQLREDFFKICVPYTDGKCGERITEDIAKSLKAEKQDEIYRIALFGLGDVLRYYWRSIENLKKKDFEIIAIADNNRNIWGTEFHGVPVIDPVNLRNFEIDKIIIFTEQHFRDIFKQLVFELNIDMDKIERLDRFLLKYL